MTDSRNGGRRIAIKNIAGYALFICANGLIAACSQAEKPAFKSIDLTGADYAQNFSLLDFNGQRRSLKDFAGKITLVFFGFTQCPDVCPTTLAEMAQIRQVLGPQGDKLQAIFISVDPERDTPEVLKAYISNFGADFVALRPTLDELPKLAKDFKIFYKKSEGKTPGSYTMDHTAGTYVFDTQGHVRLFSRYGMGAEGLASDIQLLLKS